MYRFHKVKKGRNITQFRTNLTNLESILNNKGVVK